MTTADWNRLVEECAAVADEWARTYSEAGDYAAASAAGALAAQIRKRKIE